MIRLTAAAFASITLLVGCGPGSAFDNSFRESYREQAVESCVQGASAAPAVPGVDFRSICECTVDRHMAGKSASDLMGEGGEIDQAAARDLSMQCVRDLVPGAAAAMPEGGAAPAPAADAGGAKPGN